MTITLLGAWAAMALFPISADDRPVSLACTVSGIERLSPPLTTDQVCGRLAERMSEKLKRPVRQQSAERAVVDADTVKIDVRFEARRGAIAVVETYRDGDWLKSPELSVTSMDRAMNSTTIDQLGYDIADYMSYD